MYHKYSVYYNYVYIMHNIIICTSHTVLREVLVGANFDCKIKFGEFIIYNDIEQSILVEETLLSLWSIALFGNLSIR